MKHTQQGGGVGFPLCDRVAQIMVPNQIQFQLQTVMNVEVIFFHN
jgi:hypothetical protein